MLQVSVQVNDYEKNPHGILPGNKMMPFLMSLTIISIFILTVRNSSWGKVVFTGVRLSTGGGVHPPGRHPPGRHPSPWADTPHPWADGHCSGRYASYWNAFLLKLI